LGGSVSVTESEKRDRQEEKRAAARVAAALVEEGMAVGLGTGSTVAELLPELARREIPGLRCVATSPATEEAAWELGLGVEPFDTLRALDLAIDGADQVAPDGWLVKGGGGAHLREKVVAAAAARFVVIVDSGKPVEVLGPPVPLELRAFGLAATLERLTALGEVRRREAPASPDGGVIADLHADLAEPGLLATSLDADPGVAAHGLFPPAMVSDVLVGTGAGVERRAVTG
jgi:ribose 5-phosphate isomerase A